MNCEQFETLVTDLAGDRLMDAMTRRRLLTHSATCTRCAARLNEERRLTKAIAALGEETDELEAPPELRSTLLAAFAAQQNLVSAPQSAPLPLDRGYRTQPWLLAAAAIILAVVTATTLYLRSQADAPPALVRNDPVLPLRAEPEPSPVMPATEPKPEVAKPERPAPANRKLLRSRPATIRSVGAPTVASNMTEQTTDYIPLTYLAGDSGAQGGVVVRVEIPRSTLLAMGLPVNTERGNTLVKADVVVSDDGMPRAIRLVH